jgi:hypothetical protein
VFYVGVKLGLSLKGKNVARQCSGTEYEDKTVKPVLNGPFIKRNFVLSENIFRSRDYNFFPIWFVRLLALRPQLASCVSLG